MADNCNKFHDEFKNEENHHIQAFCYETQADRLAATGYEVCPGEPPEKPFDADDIGKIAKQENTNPADGVVTFWVLCGLGPDWDEITNKTIVPSVDIKVSVSANDTTAGFLTEKVTATEGSNTTNILETYEVNDGADEDFELRIDQSKIEITESQITDLTHTTDTFATVEVDGGGAQNTNAPNLDFDGSDFTVTEAPADSFDISVKDSGIDHDATTNYVANEHIDWTQPGAGTIDPSNYVDTDTDEKVKVSSNETGGSKYLEDQIVAGTNIAINVLNEGGNEQLQIVATGDLTADCPVVQVRKTTDQSFTTSFVDVHFNITDVETVPGVVEHNNSNTDRIDIKEDGVYRVHYHGMTDVDTSGMYSYQVRVNDSVVIPGSETFRDDQGDTFPHAASFICECSAGDYLSLQIKKDGGTANFEADIIMTVEKCSGAKGADGSDGATGATGAGANIIVQKDDVTVGTVTDTLNFEGVGVTSAVDEGSNKTTVTIAGGSGDYSDGGEAGGANRTLGNTDNFDLAFKTNNLNRLTIEDGGKITTSSSQSSDYAFEITNTNGTNGDGLLICAGESNADLVLSLKDQDGTFDIMDVHADQGQVVLGKTFDQTITDNGVAYGLDNQNSGDAEDINTQNGHYRIGGRPVIYGTEFQEASSEGTSTTTSSTFQQKLRLTTPSVPAGLYRIGWFCNFGSSTSSDRTEVRVELDDTTELGMGKEEPDNANNELNFSGFKYQTLTAAAHTIDFDYRMEEAGTARISSARLEIWRIN